MSVRKRTLQGTLYKAANGHNSYEIFYATPEIMFEIAAVLEAHFGCSPIEKPRIGLDEVIATCDKGGTKLLIGWDNWSGFYIMADSKEGDVLVQEIGTYLNSIIGRQEAV